MGLVGRIISFVKGTRNGANKVDVRLDPGYGNAITGEHFAPIGDDSNPLKTDIPVAVPINGGSRYAIVGYIDVANESESESGDKRIYSRDAAGNIKAEVWLQNDGAIVAQNENGVFEIKPSGEIALENDNGSIVLDPAGNITAENSEASLDLLSTGAIALENALGGIAIDALGNVNINGVIIDPAGNIAAPGGIAGPSGGISSGGKITGSEVESTGPISGTTVTGTTEVVGGGKSLSTHTHGPGTYLDAEARPITGNSGAPT